MNRIVVTLIFAASILSAQVPKIPDSQRRFCEVLDNWQFRGGYAPGAVPKVDPNPIKAAQAPKPPDPGNLFDQLVDVFGTAGTVAGWKGKVSFSVVNGGKIHVGFNPYCPAPAKAGSSTWLEFETESAHEVPLNSPPAQFLGTATFGDIVTFSGHLFYIPANRFFKEAVGNPAGPRKGFPFGGTPIEQFFQSRNRFIIEVTSVGK
jgi:hypothetical protein